MSFGSQFGRTWSSTCIGLPVGILEHGMASSTSADSIGERESYPMMLLGQRPLSASSLVGTGLSQPLLTARQSSVRCPPQAAQKLEGTVITVMNKTVNVEVTRLAPHPVYLNRVRKVKKFLPHDETNECQLGDRVILLPDRPRSKLKRWQVGEIVKRSQL